MDRMTKIILVFAASLVLTASFANATTLKEALQSGTFKGMWTFMYDGGDNGTDSTAPGPNVVDIPTGKGKWAAATVIQLDYASNDFYGFKLGLSFQASHDFTNTEHPAPRLGFDQTRVNEAYLQYAFTSDTDLKVGRQNLMTPLIQAGPTPYPMWDSFNGAVLTTKMLKDTVVQGIVIKDWVQRDSDDSDVHFDDPLFSLFIRNKSIKNLTLIGQYMTTNEDFEETGSNLDGPIVVTDAYDVYYLEGIYKLPTRHPVSLSVQHGGAFYNAENADDAYFYAVKIDSKAGPFGIEAAYSRVTDDGNFPGVYGHRPSQLYTQTILHALINKGVKAYSVGASYKVPKGALKGFHARAVAQIYEDEFGKGTRSSLDGTKEVMLITGYNFSGFLEGLSTTLVADYAKYDDLWAGADDDCLYTRFYITYKF